MAHQQLLGRVHAFQQTQALERGHAQLGKLHGQGQHVLDVVFGASVVQLQQAERMGAAVAQRYGDPVDTREGGVPRQVRIAKAPTQRLQIQAHRLVLAQSRIPARRRFGRGQRRLAQRLHQLAPGRAVRAHQHGACVDGAAQRLAQQRGGLGAVGRRGQAHAALVEVDQAVAEQLHALVALPQRLVGGAQARHVAHDRERAGDLIALSHRHQGEFELARRHRVGAAAAQFRELRQPLHDGIQAQAQHGALLRIDQAFQGAADQIIGRHPEDVLRGNVAGENAPPFIELQYGIGMERHERAVGALQVAHIGLLGVARQGDAGHLGGGGQLRGVILGGGVQGAQQQESAVAAAVGAAHGLQLRAQAVALGVGLQGGFASTVRVALGAGLAQAFGGIQFGRPGANFDALIQLQGEATVRPLLRQLAGQ